MAVGRTRRRNADVVETELVDDVTVIDVEAMHAAVAALLTTPARACVIDVSNMTRFTPQVRIPGVPFLVMLRENNVDLVVVKSASSLTRMTAAAIALAARLPLKFVADDAEADSVIAAHLDKQRRSA